jgi:hypothetical protein
MVTHDSGSALLGAALGGLLAALLADRDARRGHGSSETVALYAAAGAGVGGYLAWLGSAKAAPAPAVAVVTGLRRSRVRIR